MPDSEIDTSDIPEVRDWSGAVRGKYYRRVVQPKPETPSERYMRRMRDEVDSVKEQITIKGQEIRDELHEAQKVCQHENDGGTFMYEVCKKCSLVLN